MPVESVWPRLEPLLPKVRKPIQYVGGELNAQLKDWDSAAVRWCLMYPDAYEVGLPNQGVMILYEVLNERHDVLAERTYSVWPDLEALLREHGIGAVHRRGSPSGRRLRPARRLFSTELGYTNLLTALELAGIPLAVRGPRRDPPARHRRRARRVQPGAHRRLPRCCRVIGDGEQAVLTITELTRVARPRAARAAGRALWTRRRRRAYVPRFYDVTYPADGRIHGSPRTAPACPAARPSTP